MKHKKIITFLLLFVSIINVGAPAYAINDTNETDDALSVGIVCADKTTPLSVDDFTAIGYIDLNDPNRTIKSLDELDLNRSGEVSIVSAIFSRASQYSQTVSFYLHVSGGILISSIRFQELKVTSTDLLFPKTFKTYTPVAGQYDEYYFNPATIIGSTYLGTLSIPTDVNKVKIKYTDMQVYALDYASYYSVAPVFGTLTIN